MKREYRIATDEQSQKMTLNMFGPFEIIGDLESRFSTRCSFYGKAKIVRWDDHKNFIGLLSYSTIVALYNKSHKIFYNFGKYSATTTRHQKEFEAQCRWGTFN